MALTVLSEPFNVSPAYNDLIVMVNSTDTASAGFKFIGEVKNSGGTTLAKLKAPVLYGETAGVFNIQRIIESYVGYDFDLENTCASTLPNQASIFKYKIELGQGNSTTEYTNLTTITNWAWNAAMTRRNFSTMASGDFLIESTASTAKFLTTQRSKRIKLNQWDWLYYLHKYNPAPFSVAFARYKSYNAAGSLLKTVDITIGTIVSADLYAVGKVPSGRNVNSITGGEIMAGTAPVIHAAATYYTIALYDNANVKVTEEYTINLNDDCSRFDSYNIYYLNPMGGFDSFMFDKVKKNSFEPTRRPMKRNIYAKSSNNYAPDLTKHQFVNYDTTETETMVLNSDWITDAESVAMHELIASPIVFLHKYGDTYYTPVTLLTNKWEEKQTNFEQLFNCQIEIRLDSERVQRG